MKPSLLRHLIIVVLFLLAVIAISGGVWRYGYVQALAQLAQRGKADLSLATDRLTGQLQLYQQLAVLTADHPAVQAALTSEPGDELLDLLQKSADKTAAMDVFLAATDGRILASANQSGPVDIGASDYFSRALQGALGEGHGTLQDTGTRVYYFAAPSFGTKGQVAGVLVVMTNIDRVESDWRGARPAVFFSDDRNEVFISNRSELLFWQQGEDGRLAPPTGPEPGFSSRNISGYELWLTDWSPYVPGRALHLRQDLPIIGMRAEALIDVDPARRLAALQAAVVAAVFLAFGAFLFLATERRRTLAEANARLESRVQERTKELSATNIALRHEVVERTSAETALKKAQADLVQAGKLSALGQMSAGISHELNQPLMAIQQYAENGSAFIGKGKIARAAENLHRISEMAARMARIIKNLRAFARNESEPVGKVDLIQVIETAVELTAARLKADQVTLNWDPSAGGGAVYARGGDVRLTQVFVNLINNAADAMLDQDDRSIHISIDTGRNLSVTVRDFGPGIREPDKVFEPFYSTKTVGSSEGMGLGLSISYGLVQSFGGNIRGTNAATGAKFTVELEYWKEDDTV
ncbi:C4-dicarboxylate transport sensor protein DctB [Thalassovita gelatinovora]|uniref:C4-dicarboxylate transport sensor protein DctB n=1 Tax=Thalassovita gelatinovora TaxID=53501 RepID=A0A0P1FEW8_THAGE|nr:ATP-binding protein [Thalassovita gelatinovora]QIZ79722.1 sensor histidine kinase [Thalassovita gelatinovora]CUH66708.1 C4-dicarboxylate transport sensor protein DctB [Thalassovita gelatinovora]SEQ41388.1 two-component system, NtrC family, C4-dicarboxylate transport sensor histidine kinase DctB [Thalassovita gelatinovora]